MNNRTHRKVLVADGRIAFTGGVCIAPPWTGHAQDPEHWRDSHLQVEGPVVAQMQAVFIDNWIKVTGDVLHGPSYFPALAPVGVGVSHMFSNSPSGGGESMQLMYLMTTTAASRLIDQAAAYFVPDEMATKTLVAAMQRGVELRIVVPGEHIDSDTVSGASRARWGPLLAAGALIAEYQPTMYHCKVMIVDGLRVSVGSTNFDNCSFRLNDEATLNILDAAFARQQTAIFAADLALSRPNSHAQWQARPWSEKLGERLASLIGNQLQPVGLDADAVRQAEAGEAQERTVVFIRTRQAKPQPSGQTERQGNGRDGEKQCNDSHARLLLIPLRCAEYGKRGAPRTSDQTISCRSACPTARAPLSAAGWWLTNAAAIRNTAIVATDPRHARGTAGLPPGSAAVRHASHRRSRPPGIAVPRWKPARASRTRRCVRPARGPTARW